MSVSQNSTALKSSDSKIGLKGFSLSSKSSQQKPLHLKNSPFEKRSQNSWGNQDDSDLETGSDQRFTVEEVTGFGEDGAFKDQDQTRGLLVIKRLKNKDWKSEFRTNARGKIIKETRKKESMVNGEWGLSVRQRTDTDDTTRMKEVQKTQNYTNNMQHDRNDDKSKSKDLDEEALQALVGSKKEGEMSHLIISAQDTPSRFEIISENEAYKRAIASAPEPSTLEDYERIPVEEFGSALLRGMGWNGEKVGARRKIKPRQNLLGLGAKELKEAEELGAWVNKSDIKRLKSANGSERSHRSHGRPKPADYKREEEIRRRRRDEKGGGSYRR